MLIETMTLVRNQGYSWKNNWYTSSKFPKTAVTTGFTHSTYVFGVGYLFHYLTSNLTIRRHGVNNAEALKSEALAWRFTNDASDKQNTFDRLNLIYSYHGVPSGIPFD
jgi:hypothetical protein